MVLVLYDLNRYNEKKIMLKRCLAGALKRSHFKLSMNSEIFPFVYCKYIPQSHHINMHHTNRKYWKVRLTHIKKKLMNFFNCKWKVWKCNETKKGWKTTFLFQNGQMLTFERLWSTPPFAMLVWWFIAPDSSTSISSVFTECNKWMFERDGRDSTPYLVGSSPVIVICDVVDLHKHSTWLFASI